MRMRWHGTKPLVIGTFGEDGIAEQYVINPGEIIPHRALELWRLAGKDALEVPQDDPTDMSTVVEAFGKTP